MDGATSNDVVKAIDTFSANKRLPTNVVTDAGPQLRNLEGNPLFNGISENHQVWKRLLSSMRQEEGISVYDKKQTTLQLQAKLSLCERAISLRPILTMYSDHEEKVLIAASVGEPRMNGELLNQTTNDLMSGVAGTISGNHGRKRCSDVTLQKPIAHVPPRGRCEL